MPLAGEETGFIATSEYVRNQIEEAQDKADDWGRRAETALDNLVNQYNFISGSVPAAAWTDVDLEIGSDVMLPPQGEYTPWGDVVTDTTADFEAAIAVLDDTPAQVIALADIELDTNMLNSLTGIVLPSSTPVYNVDVEANAPNDIDNLETTTADLPNDTFFSTLKSLDNAITITSSSSDIPAKLNLSTSPSTVPAWAPAIPSDPGALASQSLSTVASLSTTTTITDSVPAIDVDQISVQTDLDPVPVWSLDLTGIPEGIDALSFSDVAVLGTLPTIEAVIPTMDVSLLDEEFSFAETPYTERISAEIEAGLKAVLGGDLGLPQGYWDSLWSEVSNDFARLQVAELRNARNRGAATYWGLPSEAVLTASRKILDEASKKLQTVRLEMAKQQAEMAREDYWKAMTQALAYEQLFAELNDKLNARALAAAEQLVGIQVQIHNANVARYNARLEAARLTGTIADLQVKRVLSKHQQQLASNAMEIDQDKEKLARWLGEYQGYKTEKDLVLGGIAERTKQWSSIVNGRTQVETVKATKMKANLERFAAMLDAAKQDTAISEAQGRQRLGEHDARIKTNDMEVSQAKQTDAHWLAAWNGYKTEADTLIQSALGDLKTWEGYDAAKARGYGLEMEESKTNLARFGVKFDVEKEKRTSYDMENKRLFGKHDAEIKNITASMAYDKSVLDRWLGEWEGFKFQKTLEMQNIDGETKVYTALLDAVVKAGGLQLEEAKTMIANYTAQVQKIDTIARTTAQLINAQTGVGDLNIKKLVGEADTNTKIAGLYLQQAQLGLGAQETEAKLNIAQAQWGAGQGTELLNKLAVLTVGLAQALATIADVNMSFQGSESIGANHSYNHNQEPYI